MGAADDADDPWTDRTERRRAGRPRGLPNGRAVVGGFLVAVSTLGVFVAYRGAQGGPEHSFVVVRHTVTTGTTLDAADVQLVPVDLPPDLAERAFRQTDTVIGRIVVAPLLAGELIQQGSIADRASSDPRFHVSLPLERSRALDGMLTAGDRVEVAATYAGAEAARTVVVARHAEVVRVSGGNRNSISSSAELVVVLAVPTTEEALAVTHASHAGKVTLVRSTGADSVAEVSTYQPPSPRG